MMCKNLSKEDQRKTKERLKNFFNDDINVHFGDDLKEEVVKHKILKIIAIDDYDMDKLKKVKEDLDQIEDIEITSPESGMLQGKVNTVTFKGVHYEIEVEEKNQKWIIHNTKSAVVDSMVGLNIDPEAIHIMRKVSE